jgi:hypothetical protein
MSNHTVRPCLDGVSIGLRRGREVFRQPADTLTFSPFSARALCFVVRARGIDTDKTRTQASQAKHRMEGTSHKKGEAFRLPLSELTAVEGF